jgi:hypothetical protein
MVNGPAAFRDQRKRNHCNPFIDNGIRTAYLIRRAALMSENLESPTRQRKRTQTAEPPSVTAAVPDAPAGAQDQEAPPPPPPHPELDKLIGRFNGLKTMMIDPVGAKRLLATNTGNRRVNQRRVSQLATQMIAGHFENTGEPVIISDEGILNNGQHRLLAVVESDVAVEMDLRFGIPRKAFVKTDTGAPRNSADVLSIRGVSGASQIAVTLRLLLLYERGLPEHVRDFLTNDEVNRAFDRWPDIEEAVAKVHVYRFHPLIRTTPLYATTFLAARASGASRVSDWLHAVATGEKLHREHPAYSLREKLMRGIGSDIGNRERQMLRFALMIKSWNAFRNNEDLSMRDLRWSPTARDPEKFPRVAGARLK